jgi:2-succinyl-5-enolpyruvyl-6-hydroxy-3-cyclohexene-1-carboxylate synthase
MSAVRSTRAGSDGRAVASGRAAARGRAVASPLRLFVDGLARAGVRDAIVCPGSRSTPLALALRAHDRIRVRVLLDERSAGFFGVGLARTSRRPVVLLATSGTAAVNFAPAVVEASLARVPLVVLTADRPEELQDRGAPQTIDQDRLYGSHARWFVRLDLGSAAPDAAANASIVAARAVAAATTGPAGPVQVNLPLREPLIPAEDLRAIEGAQPLASTVRGRSRLEAGQLTDLAARLHTVERGLIVAGPLDDPDTHEPLARLAAATGFPILADPLSGLRAGPHDRSMVLTHADHLVRPGHWIEAHRPELVVRFGAMPISRPIAELLCSTEPELLVVDGEGGWRESTLVAATFVHADAAETASALAGRMPGVPTPGDWTRDWLAADVTAEDALAGWLAGLTEPFEGAPFRALADLLPAGSILWAGNSMPVRDMDAWLPSRAPALRVLSNRGANGIDGVVSTALGSAAAAGSSGSATSNPASAPVALVVGDVSFLHDLGALVTARLTRLDLLVVLVNNNGGGIFSLLPQARTNAPGAGLPAHFEQLFGTPHGVDPGPVVRSFGFRHRLADASTLRQAIEEELARPGLRVVELRTDRARNAELHRQAAAAVAAALDTPAAPSGEPRP